jgi:hypothetical protein
MEDDADLMSQTFSYESLKTEFNLTDKLIAQLDRKAQQILGNGIVMIDGALRDKEIKPKERINRALVFINITMELIEKNFNEVLSETIPKEELN